MKSNPSDIIDKLDTSAAVMESAVKLIQPSQEIDRNDVALVLYVLCQQTNIAIWEAIEHVRTVNPQDPASE